MMKFLSSCSTLLRALGAATAVMPLLVACGGGGGGSDAAPVPSISSASAGAAVYGQSLVLTLNGANLDQPLSVTSPGCTSVTRSTTAPQASTATTAYYACTVAAYGAQQFTVTQSGASTALQTVNYTVPAPQVSTSNVAATTVGQTVVLTLNGTGLDLPMTVSSAGCSSITRSTSSPYVSTALTAYYTCTATASGTQQFAFARAGDNLSLGTLNYTVALPAAGVSSVSAGAAKYSQPVVLTVTGSNLDQGLNVTSAGCANITRSTTAPFVSSATVAYYTCTATVLGAQQFAVARSSDGAALGTAAYTVPVPQVSLTISNGAAVAGNLVLTLAPAQAPITVNNFLSYVNSGFYNGTVFHRYSPGFVIQGGGFASGLNPANAVPALKATQAAITLEDNTGLSNTLNTVAMARLTTPTASATSQFFINLRDNTNLRDANGRGYAVFGSITSGSAFVTTMTQAPCSAYPQLVGTGECLPFPNLVITSAVQSQ